MAEVFSDQIKSAITQSVAAEVAEMKHQVIEEAVRLFRAQLTKRLESFAVGISYSVHVATGGVNVEIKIQEKVERVAVPYPGSGVSGTFHCAVAQVKSKARCSTQCGRCAEQEKQLNSMRR